MSSVPSAIPPKAIPITRPLFDQREVDAASRPILSGWVTQGPEVAAFEKEFAASVGAAHACAVSNCTTALHLALLACGVKAGDEVITVSHSFIATANAVRYTGAVPVFADIEPATFNIDPRIVERLITPRTRAVMCVHQVGMPCDLAALVDLTRRRGIFLIEDAACAIGSEMRWKRDGRFEWEKIGKPHGDVACFSFHPRKVISTGDGGMLTTSRPDWDQKFRLLRQHCMNVPDTVRHGSAQVIFESYPELGFNYRMTDIQAAVGREQLKRLPEIILRRREIAARYGALLNTIPGLVLPIEPEWARSNWQSYCVRLPDGLDQRAVMQALLDRGVASRRGVMCAHREPAYQKEPWSCGSEAGRCGCGPAGCRRLLESERATDRCVILPLYPQMTVEEQSRVAQCLSEACSVGARA